MHVHVQGLALLAGLGLHESDVENSDMSSGVCVVRARACVSHMCAHRHLLKCNVCSICIMYVP